MPHKKARKSTGQSHRQDAVKTGRAGKSDDAETGQKRKYTPSTQGAQFRTAVFISRGRRLSEPGFSCYNRSDPIDEGCRQQSTDRRTQSRRVFINTEDAVTGHDHPVKQRRLFKPGYPSDGWRDGIVPSQHLACDFRVTRFVWSSQRNSAQTKKIKGGNDKKDEKPGALGKR